MPGPNVSVVYFCMTFGTRPQCHMAFQRLVYRSIGKRNWACVINGKGIPAGIGKMMSSLVGLHNEKRFYVGYINLSFSQFVDFILYPLSLQILLLTRATVGFTWKLSLPGGWFDSTKHLITPNKNHTSLSRVAFRSFAYSSLLCHLLVVLPPLLTTHT